MKHEHDSRKEIQEINLRIKELNCFMSAKNADRVLAILSPNLRELVTSKKYRKYYVGDFLFGQEIVGHCVYKLIAVQAGMLDAIVMIRIVRPKYNDQETKIYDETIVEHFFKIRLLDLKDEWYIDAFAYYPTFWIEEQQHHLAQLN